MTPGQENTDPSTAATPMLSADIRSTDSGPSGQVTPEDVGRTSRTSGRSFGRKHEAIAGEEQSFAGLRAEQGRFL